MKVKSRGSSLNGGGYVVQRNSSVNRYINDLIRAVDLRSYNGSN